MRPCQVKLRTMSPPLARSEQCGWETARKSCALPKHLRFVCADPRAAPPGNPEHPFGFVRVFRNLTATPVSRVDRALTPP